METCTARADGGCLTTTNDVTTIVPCLGVRARPEACELCVPPVSCVPEPSPFVLLASGLVALLALSRRRRGTTTDAPSR